MTYDNNEKVYTFYFSLLLLLLLFYFILWSLRNFRINVLKIKFYFFFGGGKLDVLNTKLENNNTEERCLQSSTRGDKFYLKP